MSTDGFAWFKRYEHEFETPLEMLVAFRLADEGGLEDGVENGGIAQGFLEALSEKCRATVEETLAALFRVARVANGCCSIHPYAGQHLYQVQLFDFRYDEPQRTPSREQLLRKEMESIRRKLVREDFFEEPCRACGAPSEHVDHIIPIARGGDNALENLQPLCARCNIGKKNKTMAEFMAWRERVAGSA